MSTLNKFNQPIGDVLKDWTAKEAPSHAPIKGLYCSLEPLTGHNVNQQVYDALLSDNDGSSWTYLPYGPFASYHHFKQWLEVTLVKEHDTMLYTITDYKQNAPVGIAGYLRINSEHGVIEIGHIHFSKLLQKTPAATEALYLMIAYAFNTLQYRRCEWKCNSLNQASISAALRLGFKFEGTFRQANVLKNHNRDTSWFSILDNEWPLIEERLKAWLAPNNFDQEGKQKKALADIVNAQTTN